MDGRSAPPRTRTCPSNRDVRLRGAGKNRIAVSPLAPQAEPDDLEALKAELGRRWPMTGLLDMLKEADLRTGFTEAFARLAATARSWTAPTLRRGCCCASTAWARTPA